MAIQNRRGVYSDFTPTKMVPGEFAVVNSGDPNSTTGKSVYMAFGDGQAKRLIMEEDVQNEVAKATEDIAQELTQEVEAAIADDVQAAQTAATNASTSAQTATTKASEAAASATQAAQTVANIIDSTLTQTGKAADAKVTGDELSDLRADLTNIQTATSSDVGKALKVKTVTNEKVTEWEFGEAGGGVELVDNNLSQWLFAENKYYNASYALTDLTGYNTYRIPCDYTDFVVVMWASESPFGELGNNYRYTYEDENGFARNLSNAYYKIEHSQRKIAFIAPSGAKAIYFTFKADQLTGLTVVKNTTRKYAKDLDVADNFIIPVNASTAIDARFYLRASSNEIYSYTNDSYHTWWIHVKSGDIVKFNTAVDGVSYNAVFYNASNVVTQITTLSYAFDTDATLVIFEKTDTPNNTIIVPNGTKLDIDAANVIGLGEIISELLPDYDGEISALDTRVDTIEQKLESQDIVYSVGDTSGYYRRTNNNVIEKASSSSFTCRIVEVTDAMLSVSYEIKSISGISVNIIFCGFADANNDLISMGEVAVGMHELEIPSNATRIYLSFFGETYNSDYTIKTNGFVTKAEIDKLGISNPFDELSGVAFGTSLTYRAQTTGGYLQYLPNLSGITFDNQGVGSSVILGTGGSLDMLKKIKEYASYSGKRVCILEGFINDWYQNNPLGTFADTTETTVCGCVRSALNYILSQNANLTVFLILDPYGRNYNSVDCSSSATNGAGLTQYAFYSEIAKIGESLGIPVIREYAESQISQNTPQYLLDNIHPNALGAKQSANFIWSKMKQYYPNAV